MVKQQRLSEFVKYSVYTLFFVSTVLGSVLAIYFVNQQSYDDQLHKQLTLRRWLVSSVAESIYRFDLPSTKAMLNQAVLNDWLAGLKVYNTREIILLSEGMSKKDINYFVPERAALYRFEKIPLVHQEKEVGSILLITLTAKPKVNWELMSKTLLALLVLTAMFSLLVRWFVDKKITSLIDRLTQIVTIGSSKQLNELSSRVDVPQEISQLAREFLLRNEQLIAQAKEDYLTSLPNRRVFESELSRLFHDDKSFVLGLVDLDNFKQVNDYFGHAAGDALLVKCAQVISLVVKDKAFVARLGGDEFAFIIKSNAIKDGMLAAGNIIESILEINQHENEIAVGISASVGLAGPLQKVSAQDALRFADIALYKAKNAGRSRYAIYRSGFDEQSKRWVQIKSALNQAINTKQFTYELERIVNLEREEDFGSEMLLRLKDHDGCIISPLEVVEVATQAGQLGLLSLATLNSGISTLKQVTQAPRVFLNFNSSELLQFATEPFRQKIDGLGSAAARLVFEVTETSYLEDPEVVEILEVLHNKGIGIALDDFGTGYSSLSCLNVLPLDFVKIDRSIVHAAYVDNKARAVLRAILALRHEFGFNVIAEGIESEAMLDFLRSEGVPLGQGYLFHKKKIYEKNSSMAVA